MESCEVSNCQDRVLSKRKNIYDASASQTLFPQNSITRFVSCYVKTKIMIKINIQDISRNNLAKNGWNLRPMHYKVL